MKTLERLLRAGSGSDSIHKTGISVLQQQGTGLCPQLDSTWTWILSLLDFSLLKLRVEKAYPSRALAYRPVR